MTAYHIYVCLECGKQSRGPGGHSVAGDDICSGVHPKDGPSQPRLAKIPVAVIDVGTSHHLSRAVRRTDALRDRAVSTP